MKLNPYYIFLLVLTLGWISFDPAIPSAWAATSETDGWIIQATPSVPSGIAFVGEKAELELVVEKRTGDQKLVSAPHSLVATIQAPGSEPQKQEWQLSFDEEGKAKESLYFSTEAPGYWSVSLELFEESRPLAWKQSAFAVVEKPSNYGRANADSFFGTMFIRDAGAASRIGVKFERVQAVWDWLSPEKGVYDWSRLDKRVDLLKSQGIGTVLVIRPEIPPKWAPWKSTEELTDSDFLPLFRDFVTEVVERYKDRIAALEVVNEPDLECARGASGKIPIPEIYIRLLRTAHEASKAVAPDLPILAIDVSGVDFPSLSFSRQTLALSSNCLDIIGGHPYASSRYLGGGARAQSPDAIDTRSRFLSMAELLQEHGIVPRIWSTEFGWGLHKDEPMNSLSAQLLAAYAAQAITLARSVPEVEKLFWFSMFFPGYEGNFTYGMFHGQPPDSYPTPSAAAYATCARFLENVRFAHNFPLGHFGTIWRFTETTSGDAVFVGWLSNPQAAGGEVRMALPEAERRLCTITDALGRSVEGAPIFRSLPLFLRVPSAHADRVEKALRTSGLTAKESLLVQSVALEDANHVNIHIVNNGVAPTAIKVFQTGQAESARSRSLPPGPSVIRLEIPPVGGTGELSFTLLEEASGKSRALALPYDLISVPHMAAAPVIDGNLSEISSPVQEVKARADVLPADPGIDWNGPEDLSMAVWSAWTEAGLYLAIQVRDDVLVASDSDGNHFWSKDSLQIAWDMSNRAETGYSEHCLEIGVFPTAAGVGVAETFPENKPREDIAAAVQRVEDKTTYEILIPWSELGVRAVASGRIFRMNIIANDNDGTGRKCWIGLTPGIGEVKHPHVFRQWILEPSGSTPFPKAPPSASPGAFNQNTDASTQHITNL